MRIVLQEEQWHQSTYDLFTFLARMGPDATKKEQQGGSCHKSEVFSSASRKTEKLVMKNKPAFKTAVLHVRMIQQRNDRHNAALQWIRTQRSLHRLHLKSFTGSSCHASTIFGTDIRIVVLASDCCFHLPVLLILLKSWLRDRNTNESHWFLRCVDVYKVSLGSYRST